jgi:hypothetical protein
VRTDTERRLLRITDIVPVGNERLPMTKHVQSSADLQMYFDTVTIKVLRAGAHEPKHRAGPWEVHATDMLKMKPEPLVVDAS